jgi:PST family polysaccharide transporter
LWRFSRGIVGFNAVNYWARNLDTLALGKVAPVAAVGEYTRAFSLTTVPLQQMSMVLGRVLYPALARLRDDPRRMGRAWVRGVGLAATFTLPATVTIAITAPALVPVLFGPGWEGMVPMLVLLALGTVPQVTAVATGALFRSSGATDLLFRAGMLQTALSVIAILAGLPWGAVGVAAALLLLSWAGLPLLLLPLRRVTGLSLGELLGPTTALGWPVAGLAAAELAAGALAHGRSPWLVLALQLAAGAAVYGAVVWRTDRGTVRRVQRRLRPLLAR